MFDDNKLGNALALYKENSQDPKAVWIMHYYYERGWCGVVIDKNKAIICLKIAASQGHAGASYKLINDMCMQDSSDAVELVYKYTNESHIQKCIDKIDEYDDPPYYKQQEYISLLRSFNEKSNRSVDTNNCYSKIIRRKKISLSSP